MGKKSKQEFLKDLYKAECTCETDIDKDAVVDRKYHGGVDKA